MFKNLKLYLIGVVILFLAGTVITVNLQAKKIKRIEADNFRLESNQYQLMADARTQTNLFLKEKEINGILHQERDSLANSLQIKPKQVLKIVYETQTIHDTILKPVQVFIQGQNFWKIKDQDKCFTWQADAFLKNDSLEINRTLFDYHNKVTDVYYRKRPHKFLCFHFGKYQNFNQKSSECGNTVTNIFNFIK